MSKEFAERVFDAFEQERDYAVSGIQGSGLGMAITKSIIDLMGGNITLNTAQGQGTEFCVALDLKIAPETEESHDKVAVVSAINKYTAFEGKRLLLVEDVEVNREIASKILGKLGFEVDMVNNGKEAVDKVMSSDSHYYDGILMDIQMPLWP